MSKRLVSERIEIQSVFLKWFVASSGKHSPICPYARLLALIPRLRGPPPPDHQFCAWPRDSGRSRMRPWFSMILYPALAKREGFRLPI